MNDVDSNEEIKVLDLGLSFDDEENGDDICELNLMGYSVDDYIINQYKRLLKKKQKAIQ